MTICKYFQQGSCRFGQNCRFEHIYGSKYSYHAPQQHNPATQSQQTGVTDEQLVNQVQSDVQAALRGGQWILSSYAPFKEKPVLPGIPDLSPEEARLFIYEARASNNIEQAVAYMNNLIKETRAKYEQLLQPTAPMINVLRNLYKGEVISSPFSNATQNFSSNTAATSIFRSAVQNAPNPNIGASVFNQNNDVFSPTSNSNQIFAQAAQANQNVFHSATSNVFGPSPDTAAKSIFSQANQNAFAPPPQSDPTSIFAKASQQFFNAPTDPFAQKQSSPFQNTQASNVFQTAEKPATNVFDSAIHGIQQSTDTGVYSKMEDLTQDALEAFKSDEFRLGFVPELPPPLELCVNKRSQGQVLYGNVTRPGTILFGN